MSKYDFSDFDEVVPEVEKKEQSFDFSDFNDIESEVPEISKTESALRGVAQGASLGLADELQAGVGALSELPYKSDAKDLDQLYNDYMNLYRSGRDDIRGQNKAAAEANPLSYNIPELATAFAMPGGAAKGASRAAMLGAQVLGTSEADLTKGEVGQLAKEGLVTGAIDQLGGKAISALGKGVSKSISKGKEALAEGALEDLFKIYQASKAGKPVFGKKALEAAEGEVREVGSEVADVLNTKGKNLASQQKDIINKSTKQFDITPELAETGEELNRLRDVFSSDAFKNSDKKFQQELADVVAQYGAKDLSLANLNKVKQKLAALSDYTDDPSKIVNEEILNIVQALEGKVKNKAYNEVPEYGDINKQIQNYIGEMKGIGMDKMRQYDYDPKVAGQLDSKIQKIVTGIEKDSEAGMKARGTFEKLKAQLSPQLQSKVKAASDYKDIAGQQVEFSLKPIGTTSAYIAGKASRIANIPAEQLKTLSNKAMNTKGMEGLSKSLQQLSNEPDQRKKNALIFSLQQTPAYREFMRSNGVDDSNEDE